MGKDNSFKQYVLDQLGDLPGVTCRAMFGGHGLYLGGEFFAILSRDTLYFKTDADSQPEYTHQGMQPFQPGDKQILRSYYEVPPDVLEDADLIVAWARRAAQAARASKHMGNKKT